MTEHVFVVDDDPAMGRLTRLALRSEGYEVATFTSPLKALEEIVNSAEPKPSVVVLDLSMPEMDGREFYRRARDAGLLAPVLILSAYGAIEAKEELGAQAALGKPFEPEKLLEAIKMLRGDA
jgi:DNA-binding response OmpR family regulator